MRKFRRDVEEAQTLGVDGVSNIKIGETEGEVIFSWIHEDLPTSVILSMIALDIDGYPEDTPWITFIHDCEGIPDSLKKTVDSLAEELGGKKIHGAIQRICTRLSAALAKEMYGSQGTETLSDEDGDVMETDSEPDYQSEEDTFGLSDLSPRPHSSSTPSDRAAQIFSPAAVDAVARIAYELQVAKDAGVRVGKVSPGPVHDHSIFSVSVGAYALGLQQERLAAWNVEPTDYIVLLIRYNGNFTTVSDIVRGKQLSRPSFRIGKCQTYKPSADSAARAFGVNHDREEDDSKRIFSPIFTSASLDMFLNEDFFAILPLRRSGFSLEEANNVVQDRTLDDSVIPTKSSTYEYVGPAEWLLKKDHLTDGFSLDKSLALVAMQFAMFHVVKCTDFCMVCHRKVNSSFEAIKPFVCERPLCLFQYMNLGFGPSLEHAILTEGHVVDLLIGFCAVALGSGGAFEEPKGLALQVPRLPDNRGNYGASLVVPSMAVQFNLSRGRLNVTAVQDQSGTAYEQNAASAHRGSLMRGAWAVLCGGTEGDYHCRITNTNGSMLDFEVLSQIRAPVFKPSSRPGSPAKKKTHVEEDIRYLEGTLHPYWYEFDELVEPTRRETLVFLIQSLPSVVEMQTFLKSKTGLTLSGWGRLSPAALTILRWIVASNRSYIQYIPPEHEDLVPGVDVGWQQFRFAQGSAEKEHQFQEALHEKGLFDKSVPTLWAWHGSSLKNWHGIIREGLHFKAIMNGRAYGDGVYFARQYETSAGYSHQNPVNNGWKGSLVTMNRGIALCEIVNSPQEFVSSQPYFVVSQLHWIQCRYLLVPPVQQLSHDTSGNPISSWTSLYEAPDGRKLVEKVDTVKYIEQQSNYQVTGPGGGILNIPAPYWRRSLGSTSATPTSAKFPSSALAHSAKDSDSDVDLLKVVRSTAEASSSPKPYILDPSKTSFRPGELDLEQLPKLAEPAWSSVNGRRQIQHQIKAMVETMATTPLHEMGWYIDFENLENMYQWIVELHSFEPTLPLAQDMARQKVNSVVLEVRFGRDYPISPPFVRVVQPIFLTLAEGGGGHVQAGGAICIELLTASGWSPAAAMENVLIQIRSAISSTELPARLAPASRQVKNHYTAHSAIEGYRRSITYHKWAIPSDTVETATQQTGSSSEAGSSRQSLYS